MYPKATKTISQFIRCSCQQSVVAIEQHSTLNYSVEPLCTMPLYDYTLLGGAQPVIPPNLTNEHNSLESPGNSILWTGIHERAKSP